MLSNAKEMAQVSRRTSFSSLPILTSLLAISQLDFRTYYSIIGAALPISLKYVTLGAFQRRPRFLTDGSDVGTMMRHWIAAASELPGTHDVCVSVVDTLLQAACEDELRPHIPLAAWEWLKKRPVLPRGSSVLVGGQEEILRTVQALGDIRLITSYLLVIWSEWNVLDDDDNEGMQRLIREELNGIHGVGYRTDLIRRLDYVLLQLYHGKGGYSGFRSRGANDRLLSQAKQLYEGFRRELLELDEGATKTLAGMLPRVVPGFCLLIHVLVQDPIPPSCVPFRFPAHSYF